MLNKTMLAFAASAALAALLTAAWFWHAREAAPPAETAAAPAGSELARPDVRRYDAEYPFMAYSSAPRSDAIARLEQRLADGEATLRFDPERGGYLGSLLEALGIDVSSQMLVFSKTSLQVENITAKHPRAIYFGDDVYVAWVRGGSIEIGAMDDALGPVFYTLEQNDRAPAAFEPQGEQCLRCHDGYSLSGGGVPRFITGSGYVNAAGALVSHEGWILTDDTTPLRFRWGGWYVTGLHGDQVHLGNIVVKSPDSLQDLESLRVGNLADLDGLLDTSQYLTDKSDIVALMVLEQQVHVQNVLTRVTWDTRKALEETGDASGAGFDEKIAEIAEPLVEALFLVGEPALTDPITGTSGFTDVFEARGPSDAQGRSLRELDLETRLFKYPLSYVIYSKAFDALPKPAKAYVEMRVVAILNGTDESEKFAALTESERTAIREILAQTKPDFARALALAGTAARADP